jgi:hypothetical protein
LTVSNWLSRRYVCHSFSLSNFGFSCRIIHCIL